MSTKEFAHLVNHFYVDLYKNCVSGVEKNTVVSPLSIQSALTLAFLGANGLTAEEISSALRYKSYSRDAVTDLFNNFMELKKSPNVKLANKIYIDHEFQVKQEFKDMAMKKLRSDAENVDFHKLAETIEKINIWVQKRTKDNIKEILNSTMIDKFTKMLLVNAVYFKGTWLYQFKKQNIRRGYFWVTEDEIIECDLMVTKAQYKHGVFNEIDAACIELPYENSDIAMFIILPKKREGLAKLEADIKDINFGQMIKRMTLTDVNVTLPKFKAEFTLSLRDTLSKMGMKKMFEQDADFSDIVKESKNIFVSDVIHIASIVVDEEGAEVPKPKLPKTYLIVREIFFNCDRPFFFALKDINTHAVYLSGSINHPEF